MWLPFIANQGSVHHFDACGCPGLSRNEKRGARPAKDGASESTAAPTKGCISSAEPPPSLPEAPSFAARFPFSFFFDFDLDASFGGTPKRRRFTHNLQLVQSPFQDPPPHDANQHGDACQDYCGQDPVDCRKTCGLLCALRGQNVIFSPLHRSSHILLDCFGDRRIARVPRQWRRPLNGSSPNLA